MVTTINTDKLQIRHVLGNYKDMPDFPTEKDVMYFLMQNAITQKNKTKFVYNLDFIEKSLITDGSKGDTQKTILQVSLDNLVKSNILSLIETANKKQYEILKNIFE